VTGEKPRGSRRDLRFSILERPKEGKHFRSSNRRRLLKKEKQAQDHGKEEGKSKRKTGKKGEWTVRDI